MLRAFGKTRPFANLLLDFCNTINGGDKTKAFSQSVDSTGKVWAASKTKKRDIFDRTPPANPATYSTYKFDLSWTGGDGSCSSECSNVFYNIAEGSCGHTAGEQNIMASEATLDTGCGKYSYTITNTAAPTGPVIVAPTVQDSWLCTNPGIAFQHQFTLAQAQDAISQFCTGDITLGSSTVLTGKTTGFSDVLIQTQFGWRYEGQSGCGSTTNTDGSQDKTISQADCSDYLLRAVNNCRF